MKTKLILITTILLLSYTQASTADDNTCEKAYGQSVAYCAQGLDSLAPNQRAGAQKACVADAKLAKDACMSGVNQCLDSCQSQYNSNVVVCQTTYDPTTQCSPTDLFCQGIIQTAQSNCISAAVDTLNSCNLTCQQ